MELQMSDPRLAGGDEKAAHDRAPSISLLETLQTLFQGVYPSEARLEYLLDHIEGTP